MPANPKYLSTSGWYKFGKISAAILGGMVASVSFHLALACWFNPSIVWGTSIFTIFILWAGFIVLTYWLHKVWQIWALLLLTTLISIVAIYIGQTL